MLGRPHCTKTESIPPSRPDWGLTSLSIFCLAPVGLLYFIYLNASEGVLKPGSLMTRKCEEACALSRSQNSQTPQRDSLEMGSPAWCCRTVPVCSVGGNGPVLPECRVGSDVGQALGVPYHVFVEDPEVGPSG